MTDEELCDALVEAGIFDRCIDEETGEKTYALPGQPWMLPSVASSIWSVAGACLERGNGALWDTVNLRDPRAIITAFVESRQ